METSAQSRPDNGLTICDPDESTSRPQCLNSSCEVKVYMAITTVLLWLLTDNGPEENLFPTMNFIPFFKYDKHFEFDASNTPVYHWFSLFMTCTGAKYIYLV